jgi:cytoskeleton protein RodZ
MFEIGTSLREARLRQGLDFPELEQATKVRGKYLRALEDEEFDVLPAQTYVKGFLRAYADYLGLDGQLYVDEYNSRYVVGEDDAPFRSRRTASRPRSPRLQARAVLLTLLGIAVVTALVIVAWKGGDGEQQNVVGLTPSTSSQPAPAARPKPKPKRPTWARLVVHAGVGSSWIRVQRGSRVLFQNWLDLGQTRVFVGPTLRLEARTPDALSLRVNGKALRFPAGARVVVVTPGRLRPAST